MRMIGIKIFALHFLHNSVKCKNGPIMDEAIPLDFIFLNIDTIETISKIDKYYALNLVSGKKIYVDQDEYIHESGVYACHRQKSV